MPSTSCCAPIVAMGHVEAQLLPSYTHWLKSTLGMHYFILMICGLNDGYYHTRPPIRDEIACEIRRRFRAKLGETAHTNLVAMHGSRG